MFPKPVYAALTDVAVTSLKERKKTLKNIPRIDQKIYIKTVRLPIMNHVVVHSEKVDNLSV